MLQNLKLLNNGKLIQNVQSLTRIYELHKNLKSLQSLIFVIALIIVVLNIIKECRFQSKKRPCKALVNKKTS